METLKIGEKLTDKYGEWEVTKVDADGFDIKNHRGAKTVGMSELRFYTRVPVAPQWKYEEYSQWARTLAKSYTKKELEKKIGKVKIALSKASASHLRAIDKSTSMSSNSQARAHGRNSVVGAYEEKNALENALEIHQYYPSEAKAV